MKKKVIHIISHSHWDREWYMPFEKHRRLLINLIDDCLELFESEKAFDSFHLDGQTIILDDYLEIKPENREILMRYIKERKFYAGPWYVLQDSFLTAGESNVRNLLFGIEEAKKYGNVCKIGYFPDTFGNAGQMPQLLKQAGMEAVVFGRGVKPIGFNNKVIDTKEYESSYSEMYWSSPDGSKLLGILFANWYCNGNEIPVTKEKAKEFWDNKIPEVLQYASTEHLLFMNGCDHQPVQKNIADAIALAEELYPEYEFRHSNFEEYIKCIKSEERNNLSTVTGELTSQATNGWTTLVNTTSSRIYLKQMNRDNEVALINHAEPLAAFCTELKMPYPQSLLDYAWKKLMENHPHDSICGCSVDEVHNEMITRHKKSLEVSQDIIAEGMNSITHNINTSVFLGSDTYPFTVFNTSGWERTGTVTVFVDTDKLYQENLHDAYCRLEDMEAKHFIVVDGNRKQVACRVEDMGVRFGYDLPQDAFRKPYMARYMKVTFEADSVPAMGYKVYALVRQEKSVDKEADGINKKSLVIPEGMENEYLKMTINSNGTINMLHKESQKLYQEICYYEDTGDIGNEYIYRQSPGEKAILSKDTECKWELIEDEPFRATYKITQTVTIPESADKLLGQEIKSIVDVRERRAGRSSKIKPLVLSTFLSLEAKGHGIKVRTEFDNEMKDHRLRVIVPTGIDTNYHFSESVFEIVKRSNRHLDAWENPSGCEHQQCFTGICNKDEGIVVANYGLYEYEVLPENNNAIAITLLRSVAEMGDWGVFPTAGAQCGGKTSAMFEIIPYCPDNVGFDPVIEAYQFQTPMLINQHDIGNGILPLENSFFQWDGRGIYLTGFKNARTPGYHIVRFMNGTEKESLLTIYSSGQIKRYYRSNVIEEFAAELGRKADGNIEIMLKPYEIFTLAMEIN